LTDNLSPTKEVSVYFFNATFADRRTAPLDNKIAPGVFYTGPFASRIADEIGFTIARPIGIAL